MGRAQVQFKAWQDRTVATGQSGHYPIERRAGEIERLRLQAEAMAADAAVMLERAGVGPGWRCVDLGCGPGGITGMLAGKVGPTGRVVGVDADPVFLEHARSEARSARLGHVEFIRGDAYDTNLPGGAFDLVHVRFVASTAGEPERLFREAVRLARRGGCVAFQEPDISTLRCFPAHPAWDRLRDAMAEAFARVGGDVKLGQRLYQLARHAGLEDLQYRPFLVGVRSGDPMTDYMPATAESVRGALLQQGLMTQADLESAIAACRSHLARPDTVFTTYTVIQVWGRTATTSP
jgi:ubiquinone/menaquinone biosynthesis C-methylase UbiE